MSLDDVAVSSLPIPRPRTAPAGVAEPVAARDPWSGPGGPRPRTEYWDVATASWRSCGPPSVG